LSRSTPSTAASFKLAQAADISTIGGADEVRQHVHIRENFAKQHVVRRRVAQRCPIGAGNLTALHRLLPRCAHLLRSFRLVEPIDRDAVPAIERLVQ
jgi:hypothetical protein